MTAAERARLLRRIARRERLCWTFVRIEAAWERLPPGLRAVLRAGLKRIPALRRAARQSG